ncbi:hypothetical protein [Cyanobium sp. ATX-6F1]|uniref:hypothetical protein n=1 Tax=Cyanobium sp. ATX-6F1 TaxID=3137388 RepID=UPI0039BDAC67
MSPQLASVLPSLAALRGHDLLSSADLSREQTFALLQLAAELKSGERCIDLRGKTLGLIFTKASTRTRVSFHRGHGPPGRPDGGPQPERHPGGTG